ncbi:putative neutral ceramidase superfamily lipid hydrolase [Streptococcus rupicaprae]|uniref:Neutral ceramidase superfamily lipid hydrolase n=1 Tax=Streptococcus rupicaprae TaxID=759619 RepID=A0ABV2FJ85_9STRE
MFYLILAILLIIFYVFAAPKAIKGTLNVMLLVFGIVLLFVLILLAIISLTKSSREFWVGSLLTFLGLWALVDLERL